MLSFEKYEKSVSYKLVESDVEKLILLNKAKNLFSDLDWRLDGGLSLQLREPNFYREIGDIDLNFPEDKIPQLLITLKNNNLKLCSIIHNGSTVREALEINTFPSEEYEKGKTKGYWIKEAKGEILYDLHFRKVAEDAIEIDEGVFLPESEYQLEILNGIRFPPKFVTLYHKLITQGTDGREKDRPDLEIAFKNINSSDIQKIVSLLQVKKDYIQNIFEQNLDSIWLKIRKNPSSESDLESIIPENIRKNLFILTWIKDGNFTYSSFKRLGLLIFKPFKVIDNCLNTIKNLKP